MPKPEVLVDYYRSLVERSEGFRIAEDNAKSEKNSEKGSSSEEEMDVVDAKEGKEKAKEVEGQEAGKIKE